LNRRIPTGQRPCECLYRRTLCHALLINNRRAKQAIQARLRDPSPRENAGETGARGATRHMWLQACDTPSAGCRARPKAQRLGRCPVEPRVQISFPNSIKYSRFSCYISSAMVDWQQVSFLANHHRETTFRVTDRVVRDLIVSFDRFILDIRHKGRCSNNFGLNLFESECLQHLESPDAGTSRNP